MIETLLSIQYDSQTVQSIKRKVTEHLVSKLQLKFKPLSLENFNYFADFQNQLMNDFILSWNEERNEGNRLSIQSICREGFVIYIYTYLYIILYYYILFL